MSLRRWVMVMGALALSIAGGCLGEPRDGESDDALAASSEAVTVTGLRCERPIALSDGDVLTRQRAPARGSPDATCLPSDAPRRFYRFTVPPGRRAIVVVTPASRPALEVAARLRADCEATTCVAAGASTLPGEPVTLFYDNDAAAPRTKVLEVSAFSAGEALLYDVSLRIVPAGQPMGAACRDAIAVEAGATLLDQTVAAGGAPADVCPAGGTPQQLYTVTVPAFSRALVTGQGPPYDYSVRLLVRALESCASMRCLAVDRSLRSYLAASVALDNPSPEARAFVVSVAYPEASPSTVSYRLVTRVEASVGPVPSAFCAEATRVRGGTLLAREETRYGGGVNAACSLPGEAGGRVLYYTVRVPAGRTLRVLADGSNYVRVRLLASCGALTCLGSVGGRHEDIGAWPAVYANTTSLARDVVVAVSGRDGAYDVDYSVRFDLARTTPATNVTCAAATALTGAQGALAGTTAFSAESLSACLPSVTGPVAYYRATLAPRTRLELRALPPGNGFGSPMVPTLRVLDACGAVSCAAYASGIAPLYVDNPGAGERSVVIAVATTPAALTEFELQYAFRPLAP